jgi:hypothetical protein
MFQPISPIDLEPFSNSNILQRLIDAIGTELGEYEANLPAARFVSSPDTSVYRTNGLECLIFNPTPQAAKPLHHNAALTEIWEVRLIQRDRSKSTLTAYRALLAKHPDIYLDSHIRANRDNSEQINLSIAQVVIIR